MMKMMIAWAKDNPISVTSAVLAMLAVIVLIYVNLSGIDFVEKLQERDVVIKRLRKLTKTPVKVPSADPDEPEHTMVITVNPVDINKIKQVYDLMSGEYEQIRTQAVAFNQQAHVPMLDDLFPEPADGTKPFDARLQYRDVFQEMLGPYEPDTAYPRLNASAGLTEAEMKQILIQAENTFLQTQFFPPREKRDELSDDELEQLNQYMSQTLLEVLDKHAHGTHLYAGVDAELYSRDYPFHVGTWSKDDGLPTMLQLWEAQVGLWIQQDIAEAIARTNRVQDPHMSVVDAPVKRLIRIELVPGFVGLHGFRGGLVGPAYSVGYPDLGKDTPATELPPANRKIQDDYSLSPTGRHSNALYDVLHARVIVVVDSQHIHTFLHELQKVNFMTVLKMDIKDIDEYQALREGYLYGTADVVQVKLLLETIWLRDWTKRYIPPTVRRLLGVPPDDASDSPALRNPSG